MAEVRFRFLLTPGARREPRLVARPLEQAPARDRDTVTARLAVSGSQVWVGVRQS